MSYVLGLDASTQSFSGLVIDVDQGVVVAEASVNFGKRLPEYGAPAGYFRGGAEGEVHANPRMWLDGLELLLADLGELCDLSKVRAISGAGQQHGSVYLNRSWFDQLGALSTRDSLSAQLAGVFSRETSPIWMDVSTSDECREIATTVGGDSVVCSKSGSIAIERFTGPQIRRFYKACPAAYEETARIHLISSFLCSVLTGVDAPIDTGDGAGMNLVNIETWDWDDALCEATAPEIIEKLPEVKKGDTVVGDLCSFFTEKFGFSAGVPVVVFTGDNPSSLVGMGASERGKVVISLGTSDTFFAAMTEVVSDPQGFGHVFGNPSGGSMSLQCFANGSLAREAVKEKFNYTWDQFTQALEETSSGNKGDLMVPFFGPEISPRIDLPEPILNGSAEFENWEDGPAAVRACVEGQVINLKLRSDWMRLKPDSILLTGGASENDAIARIVADVFQTKVQRLMTSSSVSLGAALRAAKMCLERPYADLEAVFCKPTEVDVIEPDTSTQSLYQNLAVRFREVLEDQKSA